MVFITEGKRGINSLALRVIGIAAMICCLVWTYLVRGDNWVMRLNWLAFPIFAFLLVEGFNKTSMRGLYAVRLLIFAALSEVPYNMMIAKAVSFPRNQNVMFTLAAGFCCMAITEAVKNKFHNLITTGLTAFLTTWAAVWLCTNLGFEMGQSGVIIIMIFYIASGSKYAKLWQLIGFAALTALLASDFIASPIIGGYRYFMPAQAFSLLAMLIIWTYNGERGPNSLGLKRTFYVVYPLTCLIIALIG